MIEQRFSKIAKNVNATLKELIRSDEEFATCIVLLNTIADSLKEFNCKLDRDKFLNICWKGVK